MTRSEPAPRASESGSQSRSLVSDAVSADQTPDAASSDETGTDPTGDEQPETTRPKSAGWLRGGASEALSRIPFGTIFATVATVVVVYLAGKLLYRLRDLVLIMAVGSFIAVLANPLVLTLQRRGIRRRGVAVSIATLLMVVVVACLGLAFGVPLVRGITHFADELPGYVKQAQAGHGWIGHLVRRLHVQSWLHHSSSKLVSLGQRLTSPVLSVGKGAASVVGALIALFMFVLLLLLEAPKMRVAFLGWLRPATAERWRRIGTEVSHSTARWMLGNLATSFIAAVVMFVTLSVLGVPFPLLWALWVFLVDNLPEFGAAIAGIPTVLFATAKSLTAGVVTLVVFLVYWQLENRVLNPLIMSKTVRVNPLLIFVAVLAAAGIGAWIGGIFGGFVAALMAIPSVAAGEAVVHELRRGADPTAETGPTPAAVQSSKPD